MSTSEVTDAQGLISELEGDVCTQIILYKKLHPIVTNSTKRGLFVKET